MTKNPLIRAVRLGERHRQKLYVHFAETTHRWDEALSILSDSELRGMTETLRADLERGVPLDDLKYEAFAVIREASARVLGKRHFDVQVMGAGVIHDGNIAQMKTGEGKSLVALMVAYLHALPGRGVHVVTVNDYLAREQSTQMGRVLDFMGMTTGCLTNDLKTAERQKAYRCDITYGTANEFGFDYLRDNRAWSLDDVVQRDLAFAIIDEADSILIDEARTPLVISAPGATVSEHYATFARIAAEMQQCEGDDEESGHYVVDPTQRHRLGVTDTGILFVEQKLGIDNLYDPENAHLIGFLDNALRAIAFFHRDRDYIVENDSVQIVDEHTGRVLPDRRYSDNMHQAIEAKEGVTIQPESTVLASITLQHYFGLYDSIGGMTGTAASEAAELWSTYHLDVIDIPTHRPVQRTDYPDFIFASADAKYTVLAEDVEQIHATGQPILLGTASVGASERLSAVLTKRGIPHNTLNAKEHAREASIIAQAGREGAVTIATNMAGRGTDILLGGSVEFDAAKSLSDQGVPLVHPQYAELLKEAIERMAPAYEQRAQRVRELGGLCVIGTERHDSRRIDDQLRGRAGRQGDPGSSQFYVSMDDELVAQLDHGYHPPRDSLDILTDKTARHLFDTAQRLVESRDAAARREIVDYDDVTSRHREVVYGYRRTVLHGEAESQIRKFARQAVITSVEAFGDQETLDALIADLRTFYPVSISEDALLRAYGSREAVSLDDLVAEYVLDVYYCIDQRVSMLAENASEAERTSILSTLETLWPEHLMTLEMLREGIHLRSYANRDPKIEYRRDAYLLFGTFITTLQRQCVAQFFGGSEALAQFAELIDSGVVTFTHDDESFDNHGPDLLAVTVDDDAFATRGERRAARMTKWRELLDERKSLYEDHDRRLFDPEGYRAYRDAEKAYQREARRRGQRTMI